MESSRIIYLPKGIKPFYDNPRFLSMSDFFGSSHVVPYGYAFVKVIYSRDKKTNSHSWINPYRSKPYKYHRMGLKEEIDPSFFEDFYELTKIKALIERPRREKWLFLEGEVWRVEESGMSFRIMKTDLRSVWNPFFQRYDEPCPEDNYECVRNRIHYNFMEHNIHEMFKDNMSLFFEVYCPCSRCNHCNDFHLGTCAEMVGL